MKNKGLYRKGRKGTQRAGDRRDRETKTFYHKGHEGTQRKSGTKISKAGLLDPGAPHDFGRAVPNQFQIGTNLHIGVGRFWGQAERVEHMNP